MTRVSPACSPGTAGASSTSMDPGRPVIRVRVAAAIVEEGRLLLVKHLKNGTENLLLPGGGVEPGETLHEAVVRELREETGYSIVPGPLLFTAESIPPDHHRHILHVCFRATRPNARLEPVHVPDDPIITGKVWVPLAELPAAVLHPAFSAEIHALLTDLPSAAAHFGNRWI